MKINRKELTKLLGADVNGAWLNVRGPGHSLSDRSLGVRFDSRAPNGFRVHSLAGDDPVLCRKHVLKLLAKTAAGGAVGIELEETSANDAERQKRIAFALSVWEGALPVAESPVAAYLASRNCHPTESEPWPSDLRFHPTCPFESLKFPALVALMRDANSDEPIGIHRTAIKDDGSGKREMPDSIPSKMMLGRSKSAAVMLYPSGSKLGLAEGIETALSANRIFKMPVWAVMSAGGIRAFPVIPGITRLSIFADHDNPGLSAAHACGSRYANSGIEVEVRYPSVPGSDWNDYLQEEVSNDN